MEIDIYSVLKRTLLPDENALTPIFDGTGDSQTNGDNDVTNAGRLLGLLAAVVALSFFVYVHTLSSSTRWFRFVCPSLLCVSPGENGGWCCRTHKNHWGVVAGVYELGGRCMGTRVAMMFECLERGGDGGKTEWFDQCGKTCTTCVCVRVDDVRVGMAGAFIMIISEQQYNIVQAHAHVCVCTRSDLPSALPPQRQRRAPHPYHTYTHIAYRLSYFNPPTVGAERTSGVCAYKIDHVCTHASGTYCVVYVDVVWDGE